MLPFHKRAQVNSRPAISFSSFADEEMTVVRPDKRNHSSRPLLSMSAPAARRFVDDPRVPPPPPAASTARVDEAPRSVTAVDPNASAGRQADLSMTSSLSGMLDARNRRRLTVGWAAGFVALGVFAGLVVAAFVVRSEGVDPSARVTADIKAAAPQQVQALQIAAAPVVVAARPSPPVQVAAPSCAADNVAPAVAESPKVIVAKPVVAKIVTAPVAAAPKPVMHRVVEAPAPPPPVAKRPGRRATAEDMESASAADALAKAQLEAILGR